LLAIQNGRVEVQEKIRSQRRALKRMLQLAEEALDGRQPAAAGVVDVDAQETADQVVEAVTESMAPQRLYRMTMTPVVGGHAGPGTVALGVYTDD
jgi:fatty acid-binding protein DegV